MFVAGVAMGPTFFVVGPLSPGCILQTIWVQVNNTAMTDLRLRWAFALGASDKPNAAEFQAGYLSFVGPGEGLVLAGRLPFAAHVVQNTDQSFKHEFGLPVLSGAQWIVVVLGADAADAGWFWASFDVVGQDNARALNSVAAVRGG